MVSYCHKGVLSSTWKIFLEAGGGRNPRPVGSCLRLPRQNVGVGEVGGLGKSKKVIGPERLGRLPRVPVLIGAVECGVVEGSLLVQVFPDADGDKTNADLFDRVAHGGSPLVRLA